MARCAVRAAREQRTVVEKGGMLWKVGEYQWVRTVFSKTGARLENIAVWSV